MFINPPTHNKQELKKLVLETIHISENATDHELEFAKRVDLDEIKVLYDDFIVPHHLKSLWKIPYSKFDRFMRFISKDAKFQYPTKRPFTLAKEFGIPYKRPFKTTRSKGSSYPSGHAASVWFIAYYLAPKLSDLQKRALFRFVNKICKARLVAGVHTIQDIKESRRLAKLFLEI